MSHFYGVVRGGKGEATRGGTKNSGMVSQTASWQGCVEVGLYCEVQEDGSEVDHAVVRLKQWQGAGAWPSITLYDGPVSGEGYNPVDYETEQYIEQLNQVIAEQGRTIEHYAGEISKLMDRLGLDVTEAVP